MKRKILITGISSAIMHKLAQLIDRSAYEVIGISRNPLPNHPDGVEMVKGDLTKIHEWADCFEDCYMVIHGAAITHSKSKNAYYQVNLESTKGLVELANSHGVQRFAFISSNTAGRNSGAYGISKLMAEEYIKEHADSWTILRLSEVYGGDKNEGIEKLINNVIHNSIVLCPAGVPFPFYPIFIDDAARIMHSRIFDPNHANRTSVVNGPEGLSFREVIALTETLSGRKVRVIYLNRGIMNLVKTFARIYPGRMGMVPDQVDRLYSHKHFEQPEGSLMKIETYIQKLAEAEKNA